MKSFILLLFIVFIVSFQYSGIAQQNKIMTGHSRTVDSLVNILQTNKSDTTQINTQIILSRQFINTSDYTQALQYAQEALKLAIKSNYQKGIANACNNIGIVYWNQGFYEKALSNYFKSLNIREKLGDKKGIANSFNNIGLIYYYQGNYEKALNNYNKSLKIREEINDKQGIATSFNNIGNIYNNLGNYEKALDNQLKSLTIKEEIGDKQGIATSYNNIGLIYWYQGNYESALQNHFKSLKIMEEIGDKKGVALSFSNIGIVYEKKKNYEKALLNHLKSLRIRIEINDKQGIGTSCNNIGLIYSDKGNYEKALYYYSKCLKINKENKDKQGIALSYMNIGSVYTMQSKLKESYDYINRALIIQKEIGDKEGIKDAYSFLANLYDSKGDYKQAYKFHKLYSDIKDTLLNEQSGKQIAEMNTKYDSEKKDKELIQKDAEINTQQAETEKQNLQRNVFIIGFSLVLLLAFFIFRGYRQKQITNKILEGKNILIENQKQLVEEKNLKITDSINYARRIQQAILPSQDLINTILPESFIFFKPKSIVSGDFYWMHAVDDHNILVAAVDCTGHGVPGALMSMMGYNLLEEVVKEHHIYEPAMILTEISKLVVDSLKQTRELDSNKEAMDIALCKINFQNYELEFAGAHNPLYLIRNGLLTETKADCKSVGISFEKSTSFSNRKLKLEKGDCLYIFSDGYADQYGGIRNEKFLYQPFRELLSQIYQLPMYEQQQKLDEKMIEWKADKEQIDDMLIIGLRV